MYLLDFDEKLIGTDSSSFKVDRISASMIGSYRNCPLSFYYQYIAKLELPSKNLHLLFGSAVHKSIEEMYNRAEEPSRFFKEMFTIDELDDESKQSFSEYYSLGLEMVKNYLEFHPVLCNLYDLNAGKSELRVRSPLVNPISGEVLRVPFSGVLDRLTDSDIIVEYKTSKQKWSQNDDKYKLQNRLYNLWYYGEHEKVAKESVHIILLKKYKKTARDEVIQVLPYTPTIEDLAEMWEEVDTILDKIESGEFSRPTRNHASFCDCWKYEKMLNIVT